MKNDFLTNQRIKKITTIRMSETTYEHILSQLKNIQTQFGSTISFLDDREKEHIDTIDNLKHENLLLQKEIHTFKHDLEVLTQQYNETKKNERRLCLENETLLLQEEIHTLKFKNEKLLLQKEIQTLKYDLEVLTQQYNDIKKNEKRLSSENEKLQYDKKFWNENKNKDYGGFPDEASFRNWCAQ